MAPTKTDALQQCSTVPYNELTLGTKRQLLQGRFGKELLLTLKKSVVAFHWGIPREGVTCGNGSMFFVDTGKQLLGVTARHVYEAYGSSKSQNSEVICQLNNLRFDPHERFIDCGRTCDVATFTITRAELDILERITVPWPPVIPKEDHAVLFAGIPEQGRTNPKQGYVDFSVYLAMGTVNSTSDSDISMVKPPNDELIDTMECGLPPLGYDLSGMSGGPVAIVQETAFGIVSWSISGIIYENHQEYEIIKAARADCLQEDGSVRY
jgi:hypothetical protein